jgi:hypothetical protein
MSSLKAKSFFLLLFSNILVFMAAAIIVELGGQTYAYLHPAYKILSFAPDPILGWRFIPNTEHINTGSHWYAREFSVNVKINSHGFRDFERTIKKDKNTIRIALLGDSIIAAREVNIEKTAGQLLEKRLNKKFGPITGKKYEVLNFGVPGYGVDQMHLNWDKYASKFDPDFVFLYVFEKDYLRTISPSWCSKYTFGISDLAEGECIRIRPFNIIRQRSGEFVPKDIIKNFPRDLYYINYGDLNLIKEAINNENFSLLFDQIIKLPLKYFPPSHYNLFLEKQNKFIEQEMNNKRMIKKKPQWFIKSIFVDFKKNIKSFYKENEADENWQEKPHYTSGDKENFPSWITTNLVNIKTLQALGANITKSKKEFIIIDSFQFHSKSIPPTKFTSKLLKDLSKFSNFGYIPFYEKLNNSKKQGDSPIWKYDSHLNELGNKIFADSMFELLENKLN